MATWERIQRDREVDSGMVAGVLEQGYRLVAPKRALSQLDAE